MFEIGEDLPEMKLDDRLRRIGINHCCSIVYTDTPSSSSTGMLTTKRQRFTNKYFTDVVWDQVERCCSLFCLLEQRFVVKVNEGRPQPLNKAFTG